MKVKVLAVDKNASQIAMLEEYFNRNDKIEIIGYASNGEDAIKIIESVDFDVIILDLIIPIVDGFGVLEYMKRHNIKKNVIILTSFFEDEVISHSCEYGVKYYAIKPFDMVKLETIILSMNYSRETYNEIIEFQDKGLLVKVTNILHSLGIPSHIKGYQYIKSAILMVYDNSNYIGKITKKLYPDISFKYNTSISKIERAIRHAIEISWNRADYDVMVEIFGHSVDADRAKPTNSEFIVTIADKLKLDMIKVK